MQWWSLLALADLFVINRPHTQKKVERPIYLRHPETGEMHLISGAHRSAYVTDVMKRPIEAHVIE